MSQSRRHSLEETLVGTALGFIVSVLINQLFIPIVYGVPSNPRQSVTMVLIFTVASLIRGYFVRRLYNGRAMRGR